MSAKKSASIITPQDRINFRTKLQALHIELQNKESWRYKSWTQATRDWCTWETHNGIGIIAPKLAKTCSLPCIDEDDNIYYRSITKPNRIQSTVHWDKAARQEITWRHPAPVRKWIQQQYTDGEDRGIGKIKA